MIEAHALTERYGERTAVTDLSFAVRPGAVTGLPGPNVFGTGLYLAGPPVFAGYARVARAGSAPLMRRRDA